MSPSLAFLIVAGAGLVVGGAGLLALRWSGASPRLALRLAGPREVKVGQLVGAETLPTRPVRVAGRIRCREPLEPGDGDRLVAYHRDVEVLAGGRWRSIERMRESRSFELWDHDGSLHLDPGQAAEPLITIPQVWRGGADELEEPHASAAARLAERHAGASGARAVTRTLNVTDRLLVVARVSRTDAGEVRLRPPGRGYLITNLVLDDAMRLLGGRSRRAASGGVIALAFGVALAAIGVVGAVVAGVASA